MSRIAYVNGRYVPHAEAAVHIEDRGYQFADGVYEVWGVLGGRLLGEKGHMDRLTYSLEQLRIGWPVAPAALKVILEEVRRRNRVTNGIVYLQITRGAARRDHAFPADPTPALVVTARKTPPMDSIDFTQGLGVISIPDIRWKRRDIKSVSLLPNILGKQQAVDAGCYEAWQIDDDGFVTEGVATNAWIVTHDGDLVTRKASAAILNGITRLTLMGVIEEVGVTLVERPFTIEEAKGAAEAFLSSSNSPVRGIVTIDGEAVGDGKVGPVTARLTETLLAHYARAQDSGVGHPPTPTA